MKVQFNQEDKDKIRKLARSSFAAMCPPLHKGEGEKGEEMIWLEKREQILPECIPEITYEIYEDAFVKNGKLWIGERGFSPALMILEQLDQNLKNVIVYGMCIDEKEQISSESMLECYYEDCYQTALLDGARTWFREKLRWEEKKKYGETVEVSSGIGPGFFGIGMETIPDFLALIDGEKIGLREFHGSLYPDKASVGFYLAASEIGRMDYRDCDSCLGFGKNCAFCMNHKEKKFC